MITDPLFFEFQIFKYSNLSSSPSLCICIMFSFLFFSFLSIFFYFICLKFASFFSVSSLFLSVKLCFLYCVSNSCKICYDLLLFVLNLVNLDFVGKSSDFTVRVESIGDIFSTQSHSSFWIPSYRLYARKRIVGGVVKETSNLCPKEKEFSFGENWIFLRTKMKSPSDKISGLPKDARLNHQGDGGRCLPLFVNGDIVIGNEYCCGFSVSIAMEWEMNFYILVSIVGIDDVLGG